LDVLPGFRVRLFLEEKPNEDNHSSMFCTFDEPGFFYELEFNMGTRIHDQAWACDLHSGANSSVF
jgi:hypothetical protein